MGTAIGGLVVALVVAVGAYFALRGDEETFPAPTPTPVATGTATVMPTGTTAPTATPQPSATPAPSPTLAAGRRAQPAPIQSVEVQTSRSQPPQYIVVIVAGLPNGCSERYTQEVKREGNVFTITVLNSQPTGNVACTLIFRTYEVRVTIGERLQAGQTYTVRVNDKEATFRAQ